MDRAGADYFAAMQDVKVKFGANPVPLQIPIGSESAFEGVIDLVKMKEYRFDPKDDGETIIESEISYNRQALAQEWQEKLLDEIASANDEIAELFLGGEDIPEDMLKAEIRRRTIAQEIIPFFCGSARKNTAIQPLIDAIIDYLPAPNEVPAATGFHTKKEEKVEVPCDSNGPLSGLVFKIQYDREAGSLCYVRLYSGKLKPRAPLRIHEHEPV